MDIFQHITTVEEKNELLAELHELSKSSDAETIKSALTANTSTYHGLLQELRDSGDIKKEIDAVISALETVSTIELVVSRKLSGSVQSKIKDWFMTHTGNAVVLEITHDPSILAGVQITYNGRYYDGSVAEKVDSYVTDSRVREILFS